MTLLVVLGTAFVLGLTTSISPCPLATNIAAISFIGRSVGNARKVLLSGLLYTLGRTVVYVGLGVLILYALRSATGGDGEASGAAGRLSRWLQQYMGMVVGPVLVLVGMLLLGLLEVSGSVSLAGARLQDRVARGGAAWALPLGILFALSFCPVSAALFFGSLIGLSREAESPVLLPLAFGVGTAVPVLGFALLIAFAGQYVGTAFNRLTQIERWLRTATGVIFVLAGVYLILTHIYGLSLMPGG